ncbi:MAG: hypothetical protein HKN85_10755, partial [Gammaproteobacteria bacterium]|nr:hypothetical protein [Gammaproteobacteria bacterium]
GLLGLSFLVCGIWAWRARAGPDITVFVIYTVGAAIHWGGAISVNNPGLEFSLFFVYLAFSVVADTALLHLALIYPNKPPLSKRALIALYTLGALTLSIAPFAGLASQTVLAPLVGVILLIANLFSLAAGILFLVTFWRSDADTRRTYKLPLVVIALFGTFLVSSLGVEGVLLPHSDAWNLLNGLIPIAIAYALISAPRLKPGN